MGILTNTLSRVPTVHIGQAQEHSPLLCHGCVDVVGILVQIASCQDSYAICVNNDLTQNQVSLTIAIHVVMKQLNDQGTRRFLGSETMENSMSIRYTLRMDQ